MEMAGTFPRNFSDGGNIGGGKFGTAGEGKCGRKEGVPEGGREGRFADHGKSEGKRELEHALHGNEGGARLEGVGEEWLEGSGELGLGSLRRGDVSETAAAGCARIRAIVGRCRRACSWRDWW